MVAESNEMIVDETKQVTTGKQGPDRLGLCKPK